MRELSHRDSLWDPLAEAARTDAVRGAPRFSGELHERLMARVRSTEPLPHRAPHVLNPWAITAVGVVVVAIFTAPNLHHFRSSRSIATAPSPTVRSNAESLAISTPPLHATLISLGQQESALEADLGPTQLAGLDHDARVAAHYVLDPLSLPAPRR